MKPLCGIIAYMLHISFLWTVMCTVAWSGEISIPDIEAKAGESVRIPVMLDKTDNLAGIKLSMTYDSHLLTFRNAEKSSQTTSLMHIVNDKKPGVLIIVMAGAKGVKGENFPLVFMDFEISPDIREKKRTKIDIRESQLMSDTLRDMVHKVSVHPLTIFPAEPGKAESEPQKTESGAAAEPETDSPASADQNVFPADSRQKTDKEKDGQHMPLSDAGEKEQNFLPEAD